MADEYEVGYKRPPKHTQFKLGQSGNMKGRPKGTRNFLFRSYRPSSTPIESRG